MFWTGDGCLKNISALSGLLDDSQGNNYFIAVVPDGKDVQGTTDLATTGTAFTKNDVICIGNGFLSDYTVEAAEGAIPTASCTVEGFNIKVDNHLSGSNATTAGYLDEGVPGVTLMALAAQIVMSLELVLATLEYGAVQTDGKAPEAFPLILPEMRALRLCDPVI